MLKKTLSWVLTLTLLLSSVSGLFAFNVAADDELHYTLENAALSSFMSGATDPANLFYGQEVQYMGYYAWKIGNNKTFGIKVTNTELFADTTSLTIEYDYAWTPNTNGNTRFFVQFGYKDGAESKWQGVQDKKDQPRFNGFAYHGTWNPTVTAGQWGVAKMVVENPALDKTDYDCSTRLHFFLGSAQEDFLYIRGIRMYDTNDPTKVASITYHRSPRSELETELAKKPANGAEGYTAATWNAYLQAWNAAKAVFDDPEATNEDLDTVLTSLRTAYNALVKLKRVVLDFSSGTPAIVNGTLTRNEGAYVEDDDLGTVYKLYQHNKGFAIKPDSGLFAPTDKVRIAVEYYFPESTTYPNTRFTAYKIDNINYILRKGTYPSSETELYFVPKFDEWASFVVPNQNGSAIDGKTLDFYFWENLAAEPGYYYIRKVIIELMPDKSALQAAISGAKTDLTPYTTESAQAYTDALAHGTEVLNDEYADQAEVQDAINAINNAKNALVFGDAEVAMIDYSGEQVIKAGMDETNRDANVTIEEVDGKNALAIDVTKANGKYVVGYDVSKSLIGQADNDVTIFVEYKFVQNTDGNSRFRLNYSSTSGFKDSPWYIGPGHGWPLVDYDNFAGGNVQYGPYTRDAWSLMAYRIPNAKFQDAVGTMDFQFGSWINGSTGILYIRNIKVVKTADIVWNEYDKTNAFIDFAKNDYPVNNYYPNGPKGSNNMTAKFTGDEGIGTITESGLQMDTTKAMVYFMLSDYSVFGQNVKLVFHFADTAGLTKFDMHYNSTTNAFASKNANPIVDNKAEIILTDAKFSNGGNGGSFRIIIPGATLAKVEVLNAPDDVDKSALNAAITSANDKKAEEGYSNYSADSRAAFEAALTAAEEVAADAFATQAAVNAATTALVNAQNGLVLGGLAYVDLSSPTPGDYPALNATITPHGGRDSAKDKSEVPDGSTAFELYKQNNGFKMTVQPGVFGKYERVVIKIEYYWPEADTQNETRFRLSYQQHGKPEMVYTVFNKVGGTTNPAGFDSWQTYTTSDLSGAVFANGGDVSLIFWTSDNSETKAPERVYIRKVTVEKVDVDVNKSELDAAIQACEEEITNLSKYTQETAQAYSAALQTAKDVYANAEATQQMVDDAKDALLAAKDALVLNVTEPPYTLVNTTFDGNNQDGSIQDWEGYYAWQIKQTDKRFGIKDPEGILSGVSDLTIEFDYFFTTDSNGNTRFFIQYGAASGWVGNVDNKNDPHFNGYAVHGDWRPSKVGEWDTAQLVVTDADTSKTSNGFISLLAYYKNGTTESLYIKAIRVYQTSNPEKKIAILFNELPKPPVVKDELEDELAKKDPLNPDAYTEESWNAYVQAWNAAKAVYDDPEADQAAVDAQVALLSAAYQALVKVKRVLIDLSTGELKAANATVSRNEGQFVEVDGIGKAYKMFEHNKGLQIKVDENLFAATDKVKIKVEYYYPDSTTLDNTRLGIQVGGNNHILRKKDFNSNETNFYTAAEVDKWAEYVTREIDAADVNGKDLLFLFWENTGENPGYYYIRKITIEVYVEPEPEEPDKGELEEIIEQAPENGDKYTKASWEAYLQKLAEAQAVLDDPEADQEEIDAAAAALLAAFQALAEKELGDIDGDGSHGTTDARLALQAAVGKITLSDDLKAVADVDKDGDVDTTDARLLLQLAVGKIDKLPGAAQ